MFLLDPDPPEGGGGNNPPADPPENPTGTPPKAGTTVNNGTRTEREVQLQAELDAKSAENKKLEIDNGQLQDTINTMKQQQTDTAWKYRPFKL